MQFSLDASEARTSLNMLHRLMLASQYQYRKMTCLVLRLAWNNYNVIEPGWIISSGQDQTYILSYIIGMVGPMLNLFVLSTCRANNAKYNAKYSQNYDWISRKFNKTIHNFTETSFHQKSVDKSGDVILHKYS